MAKKDHKLDMIDIEIINSYNQSINKDIEVRERAKQFKLGDYVVLYDMEGNWDKAKVQLMVNSYGTPIKYKVVHVNEHGLPFIKAVGKNGSLHGHVMSMTGEGDADEYDYHHFRFELDPDFADSILLGIEYDPGELHKSKQEVWNIITKHNKAAKVKNDLTSLVDFFDTIKLGDTLWRSNTNYLTVVNVETVSKGAYNKSVPRESRSRIKRNDLVLITIFDMLGRELKITADYFQSKALYKVQPRTYKELNT